MAKKNPISRELRDAALKQYWKLMRETGRMVPIGDEDFLSKGEFTPDELGALLAHLRAISQEPVPHRRVSNRYRDNAVGAEVHNRIQAGTDPQRAYEDVAEHMQTFGYELEAGRVGQIYRAWLRAPKGSRGGKIEILKPDK